MPEETGPSDPYSEKEGEPSVFGKALKTLTFRNGYQNDGKDPGFKLLKDAKVDSDHALDGMQPGTKQEFIRGDTVRHFLGKRLQIIDEDDTLEVAGSQNERVMKDTAHIYKASFLRAVSMFDDVRVNMDRHIIVLGKSREEYQGQHEVTAPLEFEWKSLEAGFSTVKMDMAVLCTDAHVTSIGVHEKDFEWAGIKTGGYEGHMNFKFQRLHVAANIIRFGSELATQLHGNTLISLGLDVPI